MHERDMLVALMSDTSAIILHALRASADALSRAAGADVTAIARAAEAIADRLLTGGTLFAFGNGGSAADAEHLAAELVGRFGKERRPLAAHALTTSSSSVTAIANDYGFEEVFARQVRGLASGADVCVGISTSGVSENVVRGLAAGRERGALTIALSGRDGGPLAAAADIAIVVAEGNTARIQEVQRAVIHALCEVVESKL
jgi:D-sedoheptulose 7-phosphate isomerase